MTESPLYPYNEPLRFVLPLPPALGNARMHWRVRQAEKKRYAVQLEVARHAARVGLAGAVFQFPKKPRRPIECALISAHLVMWNPMDDDNAMSRMKFLLDWLVRESYLADDRRTNLRWTGLPTQEVTRAHHALRVELTITPVESLPTSDRTT